MGKVTVELSRSLTLNVGNYESIRPSVTIAAHDIDADKAADAYLALDKAVTGMMKMEVLNCYAEKTKFEGGGRAYCEQVSQHQENIGIEIEKALSELNVI